MEFRPCIDIHNGKVKQIVGGSLTDQGDLAEENFVCGQDADFFAERYRKDGLKGGHVILLNPEGSRYYEETKRQAFAALSAYPGGLQAGGGIHPDNAEQFLAAGASHVIVTSYVFRGGRIHYENLKRLTSLVGKEHLVLDFSCRRRGDAYYIVTDRWQTMTDTEITDDFLDSMTEYADEFLIHAVDVEGKQSGIELRLVAGLADWGKGTVTYAGGIGSFADLELLKEIGKNRLNATIGSALSLFGGPMEYEKVLDFMKRSGRGNE